jgi:hypothetical protein
MKKISLLFAIVLLLSFGVNAQTKSNAIKINPLSAFLATGNIQYERAVNESSSFQLGVFYTGVSFADTRFTGLGITPEYRFYVGNGEALDGFYLAPFARYQNFTITAPATSGGIDEAKASLSTFGGGLILGRQWLAGEAFVIDVFIGPSYNGGNLKVDQGSEEAFDNTGLFTGVGVRWGVVLGYAF